LSEQLQQNPKHEARLSNISDCHFSARRRIKPEIESLASRTSSAALQLCSTQNDNALAALTLQRFKDLTI